MNGATPAGGAPGSPVPDIEGLVTRPSPYPVGSTLDRLEAVLRRHGATLFARIDHAGAAERAGLAMPSSQVLIFGNPKVGTPLMQAAPTLAVDLPFKVLAWEDEEGAVWLSHNAPDWLLARHHLDPSDGSALAGIAALVDEALAGDSAGKSRA